MQWSKRAMLLFMCIHCAELWQSMATDEAISRQSRNADTGSPRRSSLPVMLEQRRIRRARSLGSPHIKFSGPLLKLTGVQTRGSACNIYDYELEGLDQWAAVLDTVAGAGGPAEESRVLSTRNWRAPLARSKIRLPSFWLTPVPSQTSSACSAWTAESWRRGQPDSNDIA